MVTSAQVGAVAVKIRIERTFRAALGELPVGEHGVVFMIDDSINTGFKVSKWFFGVLKKFFGGILRGGCLKSIAFVENRSLDEFQNLVLTRPMGGMLLVQI